MSIGNLPGATLIVRMIGEAGVPSRVSVASKANIRIGKVRVLVTDAIPTIFPIGPDMWTSCWTVTTIVVPESWKIKKLVLRMSGAARAVVRSRIERTGGGAEYRVRAPG